MSEDEGGSGGRRTRLAGRSLDILPQPEQENDCCWQ